MVTKKFTVRWREHGVHKQRSFETRRERDIYKAELRLQKIRPNGRGSMTFAEFAAKWLDEYCRPEKADSQYAEDRSVIEHHLNPALGKLTLAKLKKVHLIELKKTLRDKKNTVVFTDKYGQRRVREGKNVLKPKTINNILALAKKVMATAVEWEYIQTNPFQGVKQLKVYGQKFDFWTPEERDFFLRFAGKIDPDFTRAVRFACFTGLRLGEISALRKADVDFGRGLVFVGRTYNHKAKEQWDRTKNGEVEHIPLNDGARQAIADRAMLAPNEPLFERDLLKNANRHLRSLCKRIGARPIRFHDLRHTFASCLAMAGVPLFDIKNLMRHKSIQMTERYAHLDPGYLRKASAALCPAPKRRKNRATTAKAAPAQPYTALQA